MSAAAIRSTSARRFAPTTYENICNRCGHLVYSAEKIGPLKDFTFYHHGCFKCVACGSKLTLKTYYNNQQDQDDKEVYCQSHVPKTGPGHLDGQSVGIKAALNVPKKNHLINEQIRVSGSKPAQLGTDAMQFKQAMGNHHYHSDQSQTTNRYSAGHFDASALHIQHAVNQTKLNRSTNNNNSNSNGLRHSVRPGIESRINDFLDSETQRKLEMLHREEEDSLYRQFTKKRAEEVSHINVEIKEEWEKELEKLTSKFLGEMNGSKKKRISTDDEKALTIRHQKEKEDLEKNMTIKFDRKKESLAKKLLEQERQATAELVEKQSKEMMNLITAKLQEFSVNPIKNNKDKDNRHRNRSNDELSSTNEDQKPLPLTASAAMDQSTYPSQPPPPTITSISKLDIYNDPSVFNELDQVAINVAREDQKTFTDLVRQLTANCVTDVEKSRAIFRWITVKNLNTIKFDDNVRADTPMGILRGIKHGTESYHVLFKRLCSYVGLHCVVIKGYSKSAGYQPGVHFEDSRFRNSWNAVYVAGGWRFVQCNWGARHLVNAKEVGVVSTAAAAARSSSSSLSSSSSSSSSSTTTSTSTTSNNKCTTDSLRYEYDDHYFLTDPKEFIYEFFPLQPEWQLLRCPISLREFEELPFVRSLFFRYGLYFVDEDIQAILKTDSSGAVTVRIGMPSYMTPSLIFHYNLKLIENYSTGIRNDNGIDIYDGIVLKRFVMQSVTGNIVTFRVHAPCPGSFIMDIFANSTTPKEYVTGEPMKFKSVCKFKILCDELRTVMVPLPDCASGEWGPLKATRLFGLVPLTHEEALIFSSRDLEIQFRMSRPLTDFMASLHRNGTDERKLARFISVFIDDNDNLVSFRLTFPDEGQYGLDIYTREQYSNEQIYQNNIDKQLLTHCCKYLINVSFAVKVK
ncbi:peptidase hillarin [Dermatophagoides pteronyssinus]|uniref:peptidase hillarin n=1 Tax=Dermatophagoides pteronyssinus TaxID=6956 RepID=UPI003F66A002